MSDFQSSIRIILKEGSAGNTFSFQFNAATEEDGPGAIPFGLTITNITVNAYTQQGTEINDLINSSSVDGNKITVSLNYPSIGSGNYVLKFNVYCDDGSVWVKTFDRVDCY